MNQQPDLLQPRTLDVAGHRLAETIHELEAQGVLITRMGQANGNGTWRLSLAYPNRPPALLGELATSSASHHET